MITFRRKNILKFDYVLMIELLQVFYLSERGNRKLLNINH